MSRQYMPSSGTEGGGFIEVWCGNCARDKEMNGTCYAEGREPDDEDWCPILGASFRGEAVEWIYGDNGHPKCTAFTPKNEPIPAPRDDKTIDMFGAAP